MHRFSIALLALLVAPVALATPSISLIDTGSVATLEVTTKSPGLLSLVVAVELYGSLELRGEPSVNDQLFSQSIASDNPFIEGVDETVGLDVSDDFNAFFAAFEGHVAAGRSDFLSFEYGFADCLAFTSGVDITGYATQGGIQTPVILVGPVINADLYADSNGDGRVDLVDLNILGRNFGAFPDGGATREHGDANGDGFVNLVDMNILGAEFDPSSPGLCLTPPVIVGFSVAVPEPATGTAVGAVVLALAVRNRRS